MDNLVATSASIVTEADVRAARLGARFGRLDLLSQFALLAVENLGANFDATPRERISICLAASAGSLCTDVEYWRDRDAVGGPSPTLFAYTLPSAAIGEIAIRHRLTGPDLCFVGGGGEVLPEAVDLLERGEADACVCVACELVTPAAAGLIRAPVVMAARALYLVKGPESGHVLREIDRDMKSLCAIVCARNSASR